MSTRGVGYLGGEGAAAYLTLKTALTESANLRHIVTMSANNTVAAGSDGKSVLGQIVSFSPDEDTCTIKVKGILTDIPYDTTGSAPSVGDPIQFSAANEVDIGVTASIAYRGITIAKDTSAGTVTILL